MSQIDFRLPDLRFVPTEAVYPHELHDSQRTQPLVDRLRASGTLRNPPIVTQLGDGMRVEPRYVVLDGANRSTAARAAAWPHLLVQVVRYESPSVELYTWYHALTADAHDLLERGLAKQPGLTITRHDGVHARALLARREALACVVLDDDDVIVAHGGRTLHERNELLNALVHLYQDRLPYIRVTSDSRPRERRRVPAGGDHASPDPLARAARERAGDDVRGHDQDARPEERVARGLDRGAPDEARGAVLRGADGAL